MICIKAFKPINMEPFDNPKWKQYFFSFGERDDDSKFEKMASDRRNL